MSSFFIFSIACIVPSAFSGSGSLMYSTSWTGTICHETPNLSLSQPHCRASGSPPSDQLVPVVIDFLLGRAIDDERDSRE